MIGCCKVMFEPSANKKSRVHLRVAVVAGRGGGRDLFLIIFFLLGYHFGQKFNKGVL
jgi:hypothetical protein